MDKQKINQAINWETLLIVCNNDCAKASLIWDKYKHLFTLPMSSDFSLWAVNLNISINKLFEIYTKVAEDFKNLPKDVKVLISGDYNWPSQIDKFPYPTKVLYCLGNIDLLKKKNVAIIGSKAPSKENLEKLEKVVKALIKQEIVVTSGLSLGTQGHAAVQSLSNFAPVIAVIPTPLDQYYPKEHKQIQEYIAREGGLVITRVAPSNKNIKWNVLLRNRLMSAISSATFILEEIDRGGSVQMANYSLDNERDVFFFSTLKRVKTLTWPNELLEKGAKTIRFPSDLAKAVSNNIPQKIVKKTNNEDIVQLKLF